ncbi:MAG: hypothetical protein R3C56_22950 [Pirellulaceae bacterium]
MACIHASHIRTKSCKDCRELPPERFAFTSLKDSGLVQVPIRSSNPTEPENQAVLATWEFGAGRTAVFTSDVGKRWAGEWDELEWLRSIFSQLVRWASVRLTKSDAKFTVATNVTNGKVEVVVNALNQEDQFLNFLDMQAIAVGPDLQPIPLIMRRRTRAGVGSFDADVAGSHLINAIPGPGMAPITTGASVPFSDEYRVRGTNFALLEQLAQLEPAGGVAGEMTPLPRCIQSARVAQTNTHRGGLPRAMSMQDLAARLLIGRTGVVCRHFCTRIARLRLVRSNGWFDASVTVRKRAQDSDRKESQRAAQHQDRGLGRVGPSQIVDGFESDGSTTDVNPAQTLGDAQGSAAASSTASGSKRSPTTPGLSQSEEPSGYTARLLAAKKAAQSKKNDPPKQN